MKKLHFARLFMSVWFENKKSADKHRDFRLFWAREINRWTSGQFIV